MVQRPVPLAPPDDAERSWSPTAASARSGRESVLSTSKLKKTSFFPCSLRRLTTPVTTTGPAEPPAGPREPGTIYPRQRRRATTCEHAFFDRATAWGVSETRATGRRPSVPEPPVLPSCTPRSHPASPVPACAPDFRGLSLPAGLRGTFLIWKGFVIRLTWPKTGLAGAAQGGEGGPSRR